MGCELCLDVSLSLRSRSATLRHAHGATLPFTELFERHAISGEAPDNVAEISQRELVNVPEESSVAL